MATERNIVKAQELYESLARRWTVNYQLKIIDFRGNARELVK